MRKISLLLAIGGMVLSLLVPTTSAWAGSPQTTRATRTDTPPPPGSITLIKKTVNGTGCREDNIAVAPADDNTAFTVTYNAYTAQVGPGAKPTDRRVNCQIAMVAHVPQGFTYAIFKADYRGYAFLAPGAWGLEQASYYFQGQSQTVRKQHRIPAPNAVGPMDDDWQFTDVTPVVGLVWAPCGVDRNVNVNTELRVNAGSSDPTKNPSYINMDSTDFSTSTYFHLAWKHCNTP